METITLGIIEIFPPDETFSYFFISQDFVGILNVETNDDAVRSIRKTLREKLDRKLYNRIDFDYEGDAVIISIHKADLMFEVAKILNHIATISFSSKEEKEVKHQLLTYKRPKKQSWKKGDVFTVPLDNQTFAFAQVLEKDTDTVLCALLGNGYTINPDLENPLSTKQLKAVVSMLSINLDNHTYKVIRNEEPLICIPNTDEFYEIRYGSHHISILEDLAHFIEGRGHWDSLSASELEEILESQQAIKILL